MLVFWWHGRGYVTALIWLLTMCGFGLLLAVAKSVVPDRPWVWGLAFIVSAAINWIKGTALNAQSLSKRQRKTLKTRLFYKARNRFMSMPMETFSFVLLGAGIFICLQGLFASQSA
jgi:hypothetical protein